MLVYGVDILANHNLVYSYFEAWSEEYKLPTPPPVNIHRIDLQWLEEGLEGQVLKRTKQNKSTECEDLSFWMGNSNSLVI